MLNDITTKVTGFDTGVLNKLSGDKLMPIHDAQLLTYMKLGGYRLGLVLNFNEQLLKNGIRREIL